MWYLYLPIYYLFTGICGVIAVIVFASLGNTDGWMPDHPNNYLGNFENCNSFIEI